MFVPSTGSRLDPNCRDLDILSECFGVERDHRRENYYVGSDQGGLEGLEEGHVITVAKGTRVLTYNAAHLIW